MSVVPVDVLGPGGPALVHGEVLVPSFPADELVTPEELAEGVAGGTCEIRVHRDADGCVDGASVVDVEPACGAALLSYLAVVPGRRAGGVGSLLLADVVARHREHVLLVELEDPAHHADVGFGDPVRRAAFYARHGAVVVEVPYYQPALRPGAARVPGMLLAVLGAPAGARAVAAAPVRCYLSAYAASCGDTRVDDQSRRLRHALRGEAVAVLPLADRLAGGSATGGAEPVSRRR